MPSGRSTSRCRRSTISCRGYGQTLCDQENGGMSYRIVRIIPHTIDSIPNCGTIEVRVSVFFEWDDDKGRRLRPDAMTQEQALEAAKAFARSKVIPTD